MRMYQRLLVPLDTNGNSRNLIAIYNPDGSLDRIVFEGPEGENGALRQEMLDPKNMVRLMPIYITKNERFLIVNEGFKR